ncbi:class I SAM-dependent methyltransferase [Roseicella sp. DB1501]|uniref:class I SAM-dependent methyltransferase n=1 Tax=Roseicella sp. DB1501 TaxID=2730925 RepID=UPI001490F488|nr:class I SAM-dependent methyltransferase [Roseicella sp. DB1501]NOG72203.1 class I SAM-dependent methyltransferase [Roseicella sp. DB1501]
MTATDRSLEALVDGQFGAQAATYLTSKVHAQGADLDALAALLRGRAGDRVLDLGCGAGHVGFAVAPKVREVVACDLSAGMLETVARAAAERGLRNLRTQQAVAAALPFEDAAFDAVLSRYSAHHWPDLDAGLREAARVLRPGGLFAVVDAVSPGTPLCDTHLQAVELLRDPSHVRDRSRAEWEAALAAAGLAVEATAAFRVRMEFAVWVARMRTPRVQAEAIRALQAVAPAEVRRHFAIGPDGSFDLDVALFRAARPGA